MAAAPARAGARRSWPGQRRGAAQELERSGRSRAPRRAAAPGGRTAASAASARSRVPWPRSPRSRPSIRLCSKRVFGIFGLDQHLAARVLAPGAAGHLHDGLRQALGGPKVGAEQSLVGVEHHRPATCRGNDGPWSPSACRPGCAPGRCQERFHHRPDFGRMAARIAIEPHQRAPREQARECLLDPLGALADGLTAKPQRRQRSGSGSTAPQ